VDSAPVIVINTHAAERFWPEADPVGREMRIAGGEWRTIVGVVSNEVFPDFQSPTVPQVYLPIAQNTRHGAALLVEAVADPLALTPGVRRAVLDVDPEQPVADIRTQARIFADGMAAMDAVASMLATFAAFALVMAGAGIYGVLAFMVAERTREFGIRMALGASQRSVRTMVMRNSGVLIVAGVALGLFGAVGLGRLLASAIPEVNPGDPFVYTLVGIVLFVVAAAAAWIPARRATRVEPVVALKAD
jgi:predicted lysophospholipase L1 biosynthesis ABC-type transport system permease subunit